LAKKFWLELSSFSTLLRLMAQAPEPGFDTPQLLGVDDFALKKGQTYGTILVDLDKHRPVDLLEDRSAESLAKWLQAHPGVDVITRDRAGAYADGARRGAPEALQVADRFHLIKNLTDTLKEAFEVRRGWLNTEAAVASAPDLSAQVTGELGADLTEKGVELAQDKALSANPTNLHLTAHQQRQMALSLERRQARLQRYEKVVALSQQGYNLAQISRELNLHRKTVGQYLKAGQFPELMLKGKRATTLKPYEQYLRERWAAGQHMVKTLFEEIKAQGYQGGSTIVYTFINREVRGLAEDVYLQRGVGGKSVKPPGLTPRQAAWLLVAAPEKLTLEQKGNLEKLLQLHQGVAKMYQLAQTFLTILREHKIEEWGGWLAQAKESGIAELVGFAGGLQRDAQAVKAAIISNFSNGQVEGQVNRLKNIKRAMYGRAKFARLKARVLWAG
jgi:transposase